MKHVFAMVEEAFWLKVDPIPRVMAILAVFTTILFGIIEPVVAISEDLVSDSIRADLVMVVDVDEVSHQVSIINCNGDVFVFEEDDEWHRGDYAVAVFEANPDSDVTEWKIISVFYERPDLVTQQGFGFCFDSE